MKFSDVVPSFWSRSHCQQWPVSRAHRSVLHIGKDMANGLLAVCIMALGLNQLMLRPEALQRSASNPKISLITGLLLAPGGSGCRLAHKATPCFPGLAQGSQRRCTVPKGGTQPWGAVWWVFLVLQRPPLGRTAKPKTAHRPNW